jgi:DHA1 family inner membrane transport protein
MVTAPAKTRTGPALAALAIGTFAIGMTEFVITGLLPDIAGDLGVSIPRAGLLISGYALSVVIGGPIVTALVARRGRKPVLIALLAFFVAGNAISALAGTYGVMLGGRIVAALCHGAFIGFATIVAGDLVGPERRSSAIAAMLSGLTLASVAGVPLGTLLGQQLGWRATFWAMALLGLAAAAATALLVPAMAAGGAARTQLGAFRTYRVWLALLLTALAFGAVYAPFTYIAPLMTEVAGFPAGALPWLLALFGLGLVLGNVIGARSADRRLMPTIVGASVAMLIVLVAFAWTARGAGRDHAVHPRRGRLRDRPGPHHPGDHHRGRRRAEPARLVRGRVGVQSGQRVGRLPGRAGDRRRLGLRVDATGRRGDGGGRDRGRSDLARSHPDRKNLRRDRIDRDWRSAPVGIRCSAENPAGETEQVMLIVGLILLLLGIFLGIPVLYTIGIILVVIGAVFWILGSVGRPIGGRKYWY